MDPGNWYRREWVSALKTAGLTEEVDGKDCPRFHFHELRHYAAT